MEPRLTDGVVATASVASDEATAGRERFREAYETQFQRSLVGTAPAVGYDATLLLLEALRPGRVQPEQLEVSFEALSEIEGATGVFSIVDGRIVRRTELVRIQGRAPVPLEVR
jgi:hypothetical protein